MENRHRYRAWIKAHYYDAESNDKTVVLKIDAVDLNCVGDVGFKKERAEEALDRTDLTVEERERVLQDIADQNWCIEDEYFLLGPESIEQCTGLKDVHGTLVYEGDIICDERFENSFGRCFVGYCKEEKQFQPMLKFDNQPYCHSCEGDYNWIDILDKKFEIIGNIHENQKLIEEW